MEWFLIISFFVFFRVGMLALESLGRRVSEDRPQVKFSKTPSYGDDVRWLMTVARKLGKLNWKCLLRKHFDNQSPFLLSGLPYLQTFLAGVMNTVISPFLLQVCIHSLISIERNYMYLFTFPIGFDVRMRQIFCIVSELSWSTSKPESILYSRGSANKG